MKFLTFDQIKQQLRLDDEQATAEQSILEMYAMSAEDSVLNIIRRSHEDVLETFGAVDVYGVVMVRMRWNSIVNERSRIVFDGKTYQILGDTFHAQRQDNTIQFHAQLLVE